MLDAVSGCWMGRWMLSKSVGCSFRVLDGVLDALLGVGCIFWVSDGVLDAFLG